MGMGGMGGGEELMEVWIGEGKKVLNSVGG